MITDEDEFIALAAGVRHVRTPEGAKFFGLPIGSPITEAMYQAKKAENNGKIPKGAATTKTAKGGGSSEVNHGPSALSGPNKFKVGSTQYSAPAGSKIYSPTNGSGLKYVRTPQGEVHAFNDAGEVDIPTPVKQALKAKFNDKFQGDTKYVLDEFEKGSHNDIADLPTGTVLQDQDGNDVFEKQPSGDWEHKALGIEFDENDVQPFFDSGELTVKATPEGQDVGGHTDYASMSSTDFAAALKGLPEGHKLYVVGEPITKQPDGTWKGDNASSAAGASANDLYFIRASIEDQPGVTPKDVVPEENKPDLNGGDTTPPVPEAPAAPSAPAEPKVSKDQPPAPTNPPAPKPADKISSDTPPAPKDPAGLKVGDTPTSQDQLSALPVGSKLDWKSPVSENRDVYTKVSDGQWSSKSHDAEGTTFGQHLISDNVMKSTTVKQVGPVGKLGATPLDKPNDSKKKYSENDKIDSFSALDALPAGTHVKDSAGPSYKGISLVKDDTGKWHADMPNAEYHGKEWPQEDLEKLTAAGDIFYVSEPSGEKPKDVPAKPAEKTFAELKHGEKLSQTGHMSHAPVGSQVDVGNGHATWTKKNIGGNPKWQHDSTKAIADSYEFQSQIKNGNVKKIDPARVKAPAEPQSAFDKVKDGAEIRDVQTLKSAPTGSLMNVHGVYEWEKTGNGPEGAWTNTQDKSITFGPADFTAGTSNGVVKKGALEKTDAPKKDDKAVSDLHAAVQAAKPGAALENGNNTWTLDGDGYWENSKTKFMATQGELKSLIEQDPKSFGTVQDANPAEKNLHDYIDTAKTGDVLTQRGGGEFHKQNGSYWFNTKTNQEITSQYLKEKVSGNPSEFTRGSVEKPLTGEQKKAYDLAHDAKPGDKLNISGNVWTKQEDGSWKDDLYSTANPAAAVEEFAKNNPQNIMEHTPQDSELDSVFEQIQQHETSLHNAIDSGTQGDVLHYANGPQNEPGMWVHTGKAWVNSQSGNSLDGETLKEIVSDNSPEEWSFEKGTGDTPADIAPHTEVAGLHQNVKVGEHVPNTEWMATAPSGTLLTYHGKGGKQTEYTKLDNGKWLTPNGGQMDHQQFGNAIKKQGFSVKSYPDAPAIAGKESPFGKQLTPGGNMYSIYELKDALDALEKHSGFQVSYGLKSLDDKHPVKMNQEELKKAAASAYPDLKPKPAAVQLLKDKIGIQDGHEIDANAPTVDLMAGETKHSFTQKQYQDALNILENYDGKLYKSELTKKGSPLGEVNWNDAAGFYKDKIEGKQAVKDLIKAKIEKFDGPKDATGTPEGATEPTKIKSKLEMIKLPAGAKLLFTSDDGEKTVYTKQASGKWKGDQEHSFEVPISNFESAIQNGALTHIEDSITPASDAPYAHTFENGHTIGSINELDDLPIGTKLQLKGDHAGSNWYYTKDADGMFESEKSGTTFSKHKFDKAVESGSLTVYAPEQEQKNPHPENALTMQQFADLPVGSKITVNDPEAFSDKGGRQFYTKTEKGWEAQDQSGSYAFNDTAFKDQLDKSHVVLYSSPQGLPGYAQTPVAVQNKLNNVDPNAPTYKPGQVLNYDEIKGLPVGTTIYYMNTKNNENSYKITRKSADVWTVSSGSDAGLSFSTTNLDLASKKGMLSFDSPAPAAVDYNPTGLLPGLYQTEPGGLDMKLLVHADGTGTVTFSDGKVSAADAEKVKMWHEQGINQYKGLPAASEVPTVAAPKAPKPKPTKVEDLADGVYFINGTGAQAHTTTYTVKGKNVTVADGEGNIKEIPKTKVQTAFKQGKILDAEGNSILPKGYTGFAYLFGEKTSVPQLMQAQEYLSQDGPVSQLHIEKTIGVKLNAPKIKLLASHYPDMTGSESQKKVILDAMAEILQGVEKDDIPESTSAELFKWDSMGKAVYPESLTNYPAFISKAATKSQFIKDASKTIGDGKIIGQHLGGMNTYDKSKWIDAFRDGDFKQLYSIESEAAASQGKAHIAGYLHPGWSGNEKTNAIHWGAAVPGEVSAKDEVPGTWTSNGQTPGLDEINNYLISAQMQNPTFLSNGEKQQWYQYHKQGNKTQVDKLSVTAKQRAESGVAPLSDAPKWSDNVQPAKSYTKYIDANKLTTSMPSSIAAEYFNDNVDKYGTKENLEKLGTQLQGDSTYYQHAFANPTELSATAKAGLVNMIHKEEQEKADAEALKPVYKLDPTSKVKGSTHPIYGVTDQHGTKYVFKNAPDGAIYRAEVEKLGTDIGSAFGFGSAPTEVTTFNGKVGVMQKKFDAVGDLLHTDLATLDDKQLGQVAQEHILDWLLNNDDSKGDNLLILSDGNVVGIDKGRAFRKIGQWKGMSGDSSMNSNAHLIYSDLYDQIRSGKISKESAQAAYFAALKRAQKMEKYDPASFESMLTEGLKNRDSYTGKIDISAADAIKKTLERKSQLVSDMQSMWKKIFKDAGHGDLPEPPANVLGDTISGYDSPDIYQAVSANGVYGKASMLHGEGIIGGHAHSWAVEHDGKTNMVTELNVASGKQNQILSWLKANVESGSIYGDLDTPVYENNATINQGIAKGAQTVSTHAVDKEYNQASLDLYEQAKKTVQGDLADWPNSQNGMNYTDPNTGVEGYKFPSGIVLQPEELNQYQLMLNHYSKQIDLTDHAKEQGVKTDKTQFGIFEPLKKNNEGSSYTNGYTKETYTELANAKFLHKDSDGQVSVVKGGDVPMAVYSESEGWQAVNKPDVAQPVKPYTVTLEKASQFGGKHEDGKLIAHKDDYTLGNYGEQYRVTLPSGEYIEFRNASKTSTYASQQGRIRVVIPEHNDAGQSQASMDKLRSVMSTMGLDFEAADHTSAENTYWREMADIFIHRKGNTKTDAVKKAVLAKANEYGVTPDGNHYSGNLWEKFHQKMTPEEESKFWRDLYSQHWGKATIDDVVNGEKYLPKFDHHDLTDMTKETGKPYWERFDVTDEELHAKGKFLGSKFYHGDSDAVKVVDSGGYYSTEARLRYLGVFGSMMSSQSDQSNGAARFAFTRITNGGGGYHVLFSPKVLRRTRTYSYSGDNFGNKDNLSSAHADPNYPLSHYNGGGNETMVEDGMTFDNIEFMIFDDMNARNEAIQKMKAKGIDKLNGLPIEERLVMRTKLDAAIEKVKATWKK